MYGKFNVFTDKDDLATIKPRWTTQNEFRVDLPRNQGLDEDELDNYGAPVMMKKQSSIYTLEDRVEFSANFQNTIL